MGAIPPLNAAAWQAAFAAYQTTAEFAVQNSAMSLAEFKVIFWWEWGHRQLGRFIGLTWALGFALLFFTGKLPKARRLSLFAIGPFIALQGFIGWLMVHSGLDGVRLDVASYWLMAHLGAAFALLGYIFWSVQIFARSEAELLQARRARERKLFGMSTGLMHFVALQVLLGALVAGIDAGRNYTDWPLMAGGFLPPDMFSLSPWWRNFFEDDGLVQFIHRMSAYLLFAFAIVVALRAKASAHKVTRAAFGTVGLLLTASDDLRCRDGDAFIALEPGHFASVHRCAFVACGASRALFGRLSDCHFCTGDRMTALTELLHFDRQTQALSQVSGRLGWDQETMMPSGSSAQRGEEMAALEGVLHARRSDPRVGEWLAACDGQAADLVSQAQLREIKTSYERAVKVPGDLAEAIASTTSMAQGKWAAARAADDFAAFAPVLQEVLALKREEGQALAAGGDVYDAMLADYEPGTTASDLDRLFGALRPGLVALRGEILEKPPAKTVQGFFDEAVQLQVSSELAQCFGYDLNYGRIDKAVHPFSSGSGQDVRITTRTDPHDPFNCFYSTIHEVGHGCYEQNVDS
jgi:heme A synthase